MNPVELEVEKLAVHADHLMGLCVALERKTRIAETLIFNDFSATFDGSHASTGFVLIRETLYFSIIQDLATIIFDRSEKSPSISNCLEKLEKPEVQNRCRESFVAIGGLDPETTRRLEKANAEKFDSTLSDFLESAAKILKDKDALRSKKCRDKLIAHYDLSQDGSGYSSPMPEDFGLTWGTARCVLDKAKPVVDSISSLTRDAGFAWEIFDEQNSRIEADLIEALGAKK